jgi:hypothetical protein
MRKLAVIGAVLAIGACGGGSIGESDPPKADGEVQSPSPSAPSGETCGNGLDDNADGQVDEGCACDPNTEQPCFTGAGAQMGVGQCQPGKQVCQAQGEFSTWGPCTGSVLPGTEDCSDGVDNDCNGTVDDGANCVCKPGETRACYTGPAATRNKGACKDGTQTCHESGHTWQKACPGEVLPTKEVCNDGIDNNCDGQVDEGCVVTVNVNINGDCVWVSCPANAPHAVGCNINMAGDDCRGCVAYAAGSGKVYFQEGNKCGSGHVQGQLFCSSAPGSGLNSGNCNINKQKKYYPTSPGGCPALGNGDGCN